MSDVKSAKRVFEFLEYFAQAQCDVSVAEMAKYFGYPNSSVSSILRTMVTLGYLSYDRSKRTYLPTARLPFLSAWIGTRLFDKENLQRLMEELSAVTGAAIILSTLNGQRCQYIHVLPATSAVRLHSAPGFRPLARTASGMALLAQLDDAYVKRLMMRVGSEEPQEAVNIRELLVRLAKIRREGHAISIGGLVKGGGAVAVPLPPSKNSPPMAIAIGNVEAILQRQTNEYAKLIKKMIAKHINQV